MTDTVDSRARQAAVELRLAVWSLPLPAEGASARRLRSHRRRTMVAVAVVAVVVLFAGALAVAAGRDTTAPAGPVDVPAGFRSVSRPAGGFAIAIPAGWGDDPPPFLNIRTGARAPLTVYQAHNGSNGTEELILQVQDVGSMASADQVAFVAGNARQLGVGRLTQTPDSSSGFPGARLDWDNLVGAPTSHVAAYIFVADGRAYNFFFYGPAVDVSTAVIRTFRPLPLPPASTLPRQTLRGPGFSVRVPTSWTTQSSTSGRPGIDRQLTAGGIEGGAFVNRQRNTAETLEQATDATQTASQAAGYHSFHRSTTTLAGHPALELDSIADTRTAGFVTAPGLRRTYVVRQGTDLVSLILAGPNTPRTIALFDSIARSFTT